MKKPEDYAYSSYHVNALGKVDSMVMPHQVFLDYVGEKVSESKKADSDTGDAVTNERNLYRELCAEMLDRKTLTDIRRGTEKGLGIGQAEFLLKVARLK